MNRLDEIFSHVQKTAVFADIGCDHGFIAKMAVENKIADKILITDVSEKCLNKAVELLKRDIALGVVFPFVTDGFRGISFVTEAVIAGMGGEEIISVLSEYLPRERIDRLILQPMKNTPKVRSFLIENGYNLIKDYTFYADKKFYDLIVCEPVKKDEKIVYSNDEILFGKQNLDELPSGFIKKIEKDLFDLRDRLTRDLSEKTRNEFICEIEKLTKILNGKN